MYGSISSRRSSDKASTVATACGIAAVVAVAGAVGYSATSTLYAPAAVRPSTMVVGMAPLSQSSVTATSSSAPMVQYAAPVAMSSSETQAVSFWPAAFAVSGVAAFVASLLFRKQQTALPPPEISMAATTGDRLVWFPGAKAPAHLTGQYPGDRGFDPLGFSKDPKTFERMRISEVFHGRLAMLGVVGCLFPEVFLHKASWHEAIEGVDINKAGAIAMQFIAPIEYWRGNGGFSWAGKEAGDRSYPGFDPLGITTEDTKLREIKNGRLAMAAMLGFEVQYHVTGTGPLQNLAAHFNDPLGVNILTSVGAGSVAMFAAGGAKERPLWFPGAYAPSYLTGEFPGDRGCDPFGLAADPKQYAFYRLAEVFHGRLAMLAIVGAVTQEYLGKGTWYEGPANANIGVPQVATAVLLSGLPEVFRGLGGFSNKDSANKSYPGFDPLGLTTDYTKEAEIKNGRLAMTGMLGLEIQRNVTGTSPLTNLIQHFKDPIDYNFVSTLVGTKSVAMFAATGHKDGLWLPNTKPPAHLTGQYPGDRGFDPLSLAADPTTFERMRVSEVFHGRLAMLGVAGAIAPEILGKGAWFELGDASKAVPNGFLFMALCAPLEYWRGNGGFGWEKGTGDRAYPGFDPAKLTTERNKVAEIKNGRLAMLAILGFEAQYHLTNASPLANLAAHIADPFNVNITHNLPSIAMFTTTGTRGTWFPNYTPPAYLTGEFPGDRGFDPAGLAADPKVYARMRAAEVFNGRCAMLAVVGCLLPELLGRGAWFDIASTVDINKAGVIGLQIAAPLEYWRGNGGFSWNGDENYDRSYPGFDPLGITDFSTKEAEIKNGRLAMTAMAGFEVQNHITHQGPIANLVAHFADPVGVNIVSSLLSSPVAMFAATGHKDGLWLPNTTPPAHLTGQYPGDRGFDPLSLAADPTTFERMRVSEVFHGRLAMLGVAGALAPEILGKGPWFELGDATKAVPNGFLFMALCAPLEYWRGNGGFGWEKGTGDRAYPGFDPAKLTTERNKVAEIKNGRLAMLAILGFEAQYHLTNASPLANLAAHMADPFNVNITHNLPSIAML